MPSCRDIVSSLSVVDFDVVAEATVNDFNWSTFDHMVIFFSYFFQLNIAEKTNKGTHFDRLKLDATNDCHEWSSE